MPSLREIEDFVFRAEIEGIKEECGFKTDEEALAFYEKYKKEIRPKIFGKTEILGETEKPQKTVHNCSECDYCYTNETLDGMYICVNGDSEYCGDFIDEMGLACEVDLKELQKEYKLLKLEYKQLQEDYKKLQEDYKKLQEDYKKLQEDYKRLDKINYHNEHNIEYKEKCIFYLQNLIKRKNRIIWNMKTQSNNLKD